MATIKVTVEGVAPGLLMCSPASMLTPRDPGGPGPKAKDLSREDTAELLAYRLPNGNLGFPAVAFQRATMEAGKGQNIQVGGKGRARGVQGVLAGLWEVEPKDLIPLMHGKKPIKDYPIDIRTGLNRNTRPPARIVLARPLVEAPWEASFDIIWDDQAGPSDTPDLIRYCMDRAGRQVGIGGFRPLVQGVATGGWFGRFTVTQWEAAA